jgi:hypothetical protein
MSHLGNIYPVHGNTRFLLFSILMRNSTLFALQSNTLSILCLNVKRNCMNAKRNCMNVNLLSNTSIVISITYIGNGNLYVIYCSTADLFFAASGFLVDAIRKFPVR